MQCSIAWTWVNGDALYSNSCIWTCSWVGPHWALSWAHPEEEMCISLLKGSPTLRGPKSSGAMWELRLLKVGKWSSVTEALSWYVECHISVVKEPELVCNVEKFQLNIVRLILIHNTGSGTSLLEWGWIFFPFGVSPTEKAPIRSGNIYCPLSWCLYVKVYPIEMIAYLCLYIGDGT